MRLALLLFEDGKDFIGSPGLAFHIEEYNKYVSQGWIDITINDIEKTSGVRGIKYDMRQNFILAFIGIIVLSLKNLFKTNKKIEITKNTINSQNNCIIKNGYITFHDR